MSKFNFEPQDVTLCKRYDGFIAPNGDYYIVKERRNTMSRIGHNEWAEKYLKEKKLQTSESSKSYSMLLALSQLRGPAEILIHCYGFVYYSHDPFLYKPIVLLPKPKIFGNRATSSQMDTLFEVMLLNNEDPLNLEIFVDSNIYEYNGLEERGKMK